jgi:DNA-binding XRE family transcriptional regulator
VRMTENNIRSMRVRAGLSQEDVASSLPEGTNRVMVSFMEAGRTLPTVDGMKALCDLFICSPSDLYLLDDLDLSLSEQFPTKCSTSTKTSGGGRGPGHEGMTEFRVWVKPEEKEAIEKAVAKLGYRSGAEWFREAQRALLQRCVMMGLSEAGSNIVDLRPMRCD